MNRYYLFLSIILLGIALSIPFASAEIEIKNVRIRDFGPLEQLIYSLTHRTTKQVMVNINPPVLQINQSLHIEATTSTLCEAFSVTQDSCSGSTSSAICGWVTADGSTFFVCPFYKLNIKIRNNTTNVDVFSQNIDASTLGYNPTTTRSSFRPISGYWYCTNNSDKLIEFDVSGLDTTGNYRVSVSLYSPRSNFPARGLRSKLASFFSTFIRSGGDIF